MNTIQIQTKGSDLETITITLDDNQVAAIYESNKELIKEIADLKKELENKTSNYKWASETRDKATSEISQANTLLTALGVQLQTNEEDSYRRTELPIATRIALYIATNK
jgi:chromosome segregation ATPase